MGIVTLIDSSLVQGQVQRVLLEDPACWALYQSFVDFAPLESAIAAWKETLAEGAAATARPIPAAAAGAMEAEAGAFSGCTAMTGTIWQVIAKPQNIGKDSDNCIQEKPSAPWKRDHGKREGPCPIGFCAYGLVGMVGAAGFGWINCQNPLDNSTFRNCLEKLTIERRYL